MLEELYSSYESSACKETLSENFKNLEGDDHGTIDLSSTGIEVEFVESVNI